MSRIAPISREDAPDLEDVYKGAERALGFLPNSFLVMSRSPGIMRAFAKLTREVLGPQGKTPVPVKRLVSYMASLTSGCMYCTAHTAETAAEVDGVPAEKIEAIWEYETSPLFTDAERAALRVAQLAASVPNGVTDEDMVELQKHFDADQAVEIVASVCLFGWLNRWNDSLATQLEEGPMAFGDMHLKKNGWTAGKHAKS